MNARRATQVAMLSGCLLVAMARPAFADPVKPSAAQPAADDLPTLLVKLGEHAERFEQMKKRGSYTITGKMEQLDGDDKVEETKEMVVHVIASAKERRVEVVRYTEDGVDKTEEAQKKSDKAAKKKKDKKRDLHLPFLPSERARYAFSVAERSKGKVRVAFTPLTPDEDALEGSAWVNPETGEVTSLGFSLSENPSFVDHVEVTMRFDLQTPLGLAPSSVTFDMRGTFLVFHKHYRGSMTFSEPTLGFLTREAGTRRSGRCSCGRARQRWVLAADAH